MARRPSLSLEALEARRAPRLAALIAEEAFGNAAFKRRVMAALAGQSGAGAVAKLIDRRLAGLARAGGELDQVIALEREKPVTSRDGLGIASQLMATGRAAEALDWVRAGGARRHSVLMGVDGEDETDASPAVQKALLEAEILTALRQVDAAQALRWQRFGETLAPALLRAHLSPRPDFDDIEAEEAAFALALDQADPIVALRFFRVRPRDDLAARVVVQHRTAWSGSDWQILPPIADRLQHESPLAATILYRVLLDDILARARS